MHAHDVAVGGCSAMTIQNYWYELGALAAHRHLMGTSIPVQNSGTFLWNVNVDPVALGEDALTGRDERIGCGRRRWIACPRTVRAA